MNQTIIPFYPPGNKEPKEEYFVTFHNNEDKHAPGAISHIIGSAQISIRSTNNSYGAIPIEGDAYIKMLRDALIKICEIKEFESLFEELTGIKPGDAKKDDQGFLFIPPESNFAEKDRKKRGRLAELAGENWRNHIVDDNYAGWWMGTPLHGITKKS